jgi:transcriptional regulator with XRE-family HTH domain
LHVAQRFERLLDTYRRPDGQRWGGAELEKTTGGIVSRSYVTNLRKGRMENPGFEKIRALAKAMGWRGPPAGSEGRGIPGRLEHLFKTIKNPKTGEPYTNAEVARMSAGDLSVEDVEGIRTGKITDPSVGRVAARAAAFGVPPSYLLDQRKEPSVLDEEVLEALADETSAAILKESVSLSEREKEIVLGIVRQFSDQHGAGEL